MIILIEDWINYLKYFDRSNKRKRDRKISGNYKPLNRNVFN